MTENESNYSSSSSSSSSDLDAEDNGNIKDGKSLKDNVTNETKQKLPSATQLLTTANSRSSGDVFKNPFREAESAKIAILEKHVKMVNKNEHIIEKNGRKICWNYRKGRCRFGSNCSFAHDSDLSTDPSKGVSGKDHPHENISSENESSNQHQYGQQKTTSTLEFQGNKSSEPSGCSTNTLNAKRKRPGLSDSVTPSKRVIKSYMHGKQQKT